MWANKWIQTTRTTSIFDKNLTRLISDSRPNNTNKIKSVTRHNNINNPMDIPLTVYQKWHTKDLPLFMNEVVNYNKIKNPEFNFQLYDDDDCRNFIANNFDDSVLKAFDKLIPETYKTDLWRLCILYKYGGIYLDIKFECVNDFQLILITQQEHFLLDIGNDNYGNRAISNALMVSLPNNEKLLKAINKIVWNVNNNYYGTSASDPTGPTMLAPIFNGNSTSSVSLKLTNEKDGILFNDTYALLEYSAYKDEKNKICIHYSTYWNNKNIYRTYDSEDT
jgi:mannosyltransferase OCH1-like enzyme